VLELPEHIEVDAAAARRMATGATPERAGLAAPSEVTAYLHDGALLAVHGPGRDGTPVRLVWAAPADLSAGRADGGGDA
jgi:hypothetical protein